MFETNNKHFELFLNNFQLFWIRNSNTLFALNANVYTHKIGEQAAQQQDFRHVLEFNTENPIQKSMLNIELKVECYLYL